MKKLNKCRNKRMEEEKTQGSTEKSLETWKLTSPDDLYFFISTTILGIEFSVILLLPPGCFVASSIELLCIALG